MILRILFIAGFSLSAACICAQNLDETRQLADQFFDDQQYQEALLTYERVAFFSRPAADSRLLGKIADCFYLTGDFTRALEYYDHAWFSAKNTDEKAALLFSKVLTLLELKNYHSAQIELFSFQPPQGSPLAYKKEAYLAATYFGLENFNLAIEHFLKAVPDHQTEAKAHLESIFANQKRLNRPNPKTAMILSICLPGSGQLYAGEPGAALNSLLLTSAFVGLVIYLTIRVNPIEAILTGSPWFQRYYQGGFEHAASAATIKRQENRNAIYHEALITTIKSWQ